MATASAAVPVVPAARFGAHPGKGTSRAGTGRMNRRAVGYMTSMTRRPAVVAAWLWAIVVLLWAGRASYDLVRLVGPDVLFGALVFVAVAMAVVQVRRHGLAVRARSVTGKASVRS